MEEKNNTTNNEPSQENRVVFFPIPEENRIPFCPIEQKEVNQAALRRHGYLAQKKLEARIGD